MSQAEQSHMSILHVADLPHWDWDDLQDKLKRANHIEWCRKKGIPDDDIQRALRYNSENINPTINQARGVLTTFGLADTVDITRSKKGIWSLTGRNGEIVFAQPIEKKSGAHAFTDGGVIVVFAKPVISRAA